MYPALIPNESHHFYPVFLQIDWLDRRVIGMGWSDQEHLVIVLEDGNCLIYDIHGKLVRNFLLLDAVATAHVLECHFWGNGVVAITSDMQLFVAEVLLLMKVMIWYLVHQLFSCIGLVQRRG